MASKMQQLVRWMPSKIKEYLIEGCGLKCIENALIYSAVQIYHGFIH